MLAICCDQNASERDEDLLFLPLLSLLPIPFLSQIRATFTSAHPSATPPAPTLTPAEPTTQTPAQSIAAAALAAVREAAQGNPAQHGKLKVHRTNMLLEERGLIHDRSPTDHGIFLGWLGG